MRVSMTHKMLSVLALAVVLVGCEDDEQRHRRMLELKEQERITKIEVATVEAKSREAELIKTLKAQREEQEFQANLERKRLLEEQEQSRNNSLLNAEIERHARMLEQETAHKTLLFEDQRERDIANAIEKTKRQQIMEKEESSRRAAKLRAETERIKTAKQAETAQVMATEQAKTEKIRAIEKTKIEKIAIESSTALKQAIGGIALVVAGFIAVGFWIYKGFIFMTGEVAKTNRVRVAMRELADANNGLSDELRERLITKAIEISAPPKLLPKSS